LESTRRFHAQGSSVSEARNRPDNTARRHIAQDRTTAIITIIIIAVVLRRNILFHGHENNGRSVEINYHLTTAKKVYGAESSLRNRQSLSYSRFSQYFMEPEGSLPCSKESSTDLYPEPDQSTPYHPSLSL
jgi:hypothetical protein